MNGSVLIVDDNVALANLLAIFLTQLGFEPVQANDAESGMAAWNDHKESILAVLQDVNMSDPAAAAVGATIRIQNPKVKLIYMSGMGAEEFASLKTGEAFLKKPFTISDLESALSDCSVAS